MTLVAVLLLLAGGHGLARVLTGILPVRLVGHLAAAALSILLGASAVGLITTYAGVLGLSTTSWPVIVPILILLALAGLAPANVARRLRIERANETRERLFRSTVRVDGVIAAVVCAIGATVLWGIRSVPVRSNDEYAIWAVRGRALSMIGHLDPAVFVGTQANYQHLDYPLLVPSLIAWGDGLSGRVDDLTAHVLLIGLVLAMLALVGWALGQLAGPIAAIGGVLLVAGTPGLLSRWVLLLMADAPLAAFAVSLVLLLALWLTRRDGRLLAITAVLAAGAAATKVEGALFAFAALAAAAICARGRRRQVLLAFAVVVASMLPWLVWTRLHGLNSDLINSTTLNPRHLAVVAPYGWLTVKEIVHYWPGFGWLMALAGLGAAALASLRPGRRGAVAYLAAVLALSILGMWGQYVVSAGQVLTGDAGAHALQSHFASSASRALLVPSILLSLAVPLFAGAALDRRRGTSSPDDRVDTLDVRTAATARQPQHASPAKRIARRGEGLT